MSPVAYGKIPEGYAQIYPERGEAPPIVEGEHYYVRIVTANANGDDGYFMLRNGKVIFAKYESELLEN
jgi:predicted RNA-binding protein with TRAM domain